MVQFISRPKSFGDQMAESLNRGFMKAMDFSEQLRGEEFKEAQREREKQRDEQRQQQQSQQTADVFKQMTGMDIFGLPPNAQQEFVKQFAKSQSKMQTIRQLFPEMGIDQGNMGQKLQSGEPPVQDSQMFPEEQISGAEQPETTDEEVKPISKKTKWGNMSEGQKAYLAMELPQVARELQEEDKISRKEGIEATKERKESVKKVLDKVEQSRDSLLQRRSDYAIAEQQIRQAPGDVGSLKNFISDAYNLPGLKSASAAAFSGVMKDAYINDLKKIPGVKLNQFIDKTLFSALPRVGQSDEANLNLLELGKFKLDLEEKYNDTVDAIKQKYESKNQDIPADIGSEAYKMLKPYAEERQKELAYDIRVNFENEKGRVNLQKEALKAVPKGTPLTIEMAEILLEKAKKNKMGEATEEDKQAALNIAKNLGYELPDERFLIKRGYIMGEE